MARPEGKERGLAIGDRLVTSQMTYLVVFFDGGRAEEELEYTVLGGPGGGAVTSQNLVTRTLLQPYPTPRGGRTRSRALSFRMT